MVFTAQLPMTQEYNKSSGLMIRRDANIRQLDLVLDEARRVGIRVICALCNNWEQFGYAGGHGVLCC